MYPQNTLIVIAVLVILAFAIIYFQIKKLVDSKSQDETTKLLTQLVSDMRGSMDKTTDSMVRQTKAINERLDRAAQVISGVSKSVGEMTEIGRSMRELQEFLRSPKMRGQMGEAILKDLLGQTLPKQNFHLQYAFKGGEIVDAALKLEQGIIPIDAKFPLDNFRKMIEAKEERERKNYYREFENDVKKHIDDISKKYILTEEGTIDYALMYLPSETVYYEVVNDLTLFDYSQNKRVLPVSPMTFYAYLRAILMSFEGQKIEEQAKKILSAIRAIQKDYLKVEDNMSVLNRHVVNAYNQMNNLVSSFTLLGQKISSTQTLDTVKKEEIKQPEIS